MDVPTTWHGGHVMLKDGRQLEGELIVMTGHYVVGEVIFQEWEIETIEDLT